MTSNETEPLSDLEYRMLLDHPDGAAVIATMIEEESRGEA